MWETQEETKKKQMQKNIRTERINLSVECRRANLKTSFHSDNIPVFSWGMCRVHYYSSRKILLLDKLLALAHLNDTLEKHDN